MDAAHFEKTLSSEVLFEGRVVTLTKDVALLENGETSIREVVHHHGGACIVPYFEDGTLCMVRQFRYAMQQELWELPAGKLERAKALEPPSGSWAKCGLTADHYTPLGEFYPTVGYDTEIIYMWVATGLHTTQMHLDDDEFLTPDRIPLAKAYEMVMSGEIKRTARTIAGVLEAQGTLVDEETGCDTLRRYSPRGSGQARRAFQRGQRTRRPAEALGQADAAVGVIHRLDTGVWSDGLCKTPQAAAAAQPAGDAEPAGLCRTGWRAEPDAGTPAAPPFVKQYRASSRAGRTKAALPAEGICGTTYSGQPERPCFR